MGISLDNIDKIVDRDTHAKNVNLNYKLREELRIERQKIFEQREGIVVYTTMEPTEALMLGSNIVDIDEDRIMQTGLTPDIYHNPATTNLGLHAMTYFYFELF